MAKQDVVTAFSSPELRGSFPDLGRFQSEATARFDVIGTFVERIYGLYLERVGEEVNFLVISVCQGDAKAFVQSSYVQNRNNRLISVKSKRHVEL